MSFRFEDFADTASAHAAFEAAFPPGSPAEPALQALVEMGAQCRTVGPSSFACRYIEKDKVLAGFCWHLALDSDRAFQEETRNAARALVKAVKLSRAGKLPQPDSGLADPRPK